MTSEQYLIAKYNKLQLTMDELAAELQMDKKSMLNSISAGRLKVPTWKDNGRRYVDIRDLASYWDRRHQPSLEEM